MSSLMSDNIFEIYIYSKVQLSYECNVLINLDGICKNLVVT